MDCFVHIPKTGGHTLRWVVQKQESRSLLARNEYSREALRQSLSDAELDNHSILWGHVVHGVDLLAAEPVRYFSILRGLVDLVISWYYFVRRIGGPASDSIVEQDLSLEEFVASDEYWYGIPHTNNLQTRMLSGVGNTVPPGNCTANMLDAAKQNVDTDFAVVGLLERFDETLLLFRRELDWGLPIYVRRNSTSNRPAKSDLPSSTVDLIRDRNALDLELYDYCREQFEERVSALNLSRDLQLLSLANAAYAPTLGIYVKARETYNSILGREQW
jgi:hypothetical protein